MKVKIYTTPTCPFCIKTKEFLTQHNIEYEEINVAGNPEAAHEMIQNHENRMASSTAPARRSRYRRVARAVCACADGSKR